MLLFWLAAFWSATNDIASDGYYILALSEKQQAFFIGIRSTSYRLSIIFGQGGIIILAGLLFDQWKNYSQAWSIAMYLAGGVMLLLFFGNWKLSPVIKEKSLEKSQANFGALFRSFFKKKGIGISLTYILIYRLGESQLVKIASPFLLDKVGVGGLGLSTTQVGTFYGTFGWIALSLGGILGGYLISRQGLGRWIFANGDST